MSYINSLGKNALVYEFQQKMKNIDQIAQLAIENNQKKVTQKYGNIQSTAKILKSLIIQFTKKSFKIQQELRQAAKIDDLKYQTQYHIKRLQQCEKLSSDLQILIKSNRNKIQLYEEECQKLKQQLILAKTDNIKKILKIEMLENQAEVKAANQKQQEKFQTFKSKINQNRVFMQTGLSYIPSSFDLLKKQKSQLSTVLWQKINKKIVISKYLSESYERLKQKLIKQQRKSNLDGLNGSLFFKLQQNDKLSKKLGPTVSRKNKFDQKLIVYDILKQKYSNQIKAQSKKQTEIKVDYQNFMNFTPMQLSGLIELKGGISNLQKKREFLSQNFGKNIENSKKKSNTGVKQTKKENYLKMYIMSRKQ